MSVLTGTLRIQNSYRGVGVEQGECTSPEGNTGRRAAVGGQGHSHQRSTPVRNFSRFEIDANLASGIEAYINLVPHAVRLDVGGGANAQGLGDTDD